MEDEAVFIAELLNPKTQNLAFQKLVQLNQKQLYFQIRNIVISHDDADDVLQNTFIKIYQNLNKFNRESKLSTWMFRIATNESLTFIAKKAKQYKQTSEELQQKLVDNLEADTFFEGDELELKLQKAIALLPEKQQLVFKMHYFEELKYEEISEIIGTSVGALKANYHHAVKKIEEFINNN